MSQTQTKTKNDFACLNLSLKFISTLDKLGFVTPTPIQLKAIPEAVEGRDLIGIAQTGTGKTLAFGLPMIQSLLEQRGRGLILVPTRELALQVEETILKVGNSFGIRTAVLIGGASMRHQVAQVRRGPHIIIATPGRLMDHMMQRTVNLRDVRIVVLDEADRMLDMGFAPSIRKILAEVPDDRQTMLFSATMPREILSIAADYLYEPVRVEVASEGTTADGITQELIVVEKPDKGAMLNQLLKKMTGTTLVFSRTKHGARKIAHSLRTHGHNAVEIHSDRTLAQRRAALDGFKNGQYRILVATDIAARGIDVKSIGTVVNYDLPENPEDYIHRIGRTGRAGETGHAITFASPDQASDVRAIERLIKSDLPLSDDSVLSLPKARQAQPVRNPFGTRTTSKGPRGSWSYGRMGSTARR